MTEPAKFDPIGFAVGSEYVTVLGHGNINAVELPIDLLEQICLALPSAQQTALTDEKREQEYMFPDNQPKTALEAFDNMIGHYRDLLKDTNNIVEEEITDFENEIRASLQSGPAVKEGWKLVPIEPTPEMLVAGDTYARQNSPKAGIWWLRRVFEVMISAAPEVE